MIGTRRTLLGVGLVALLCAGAWSLLTRGSAREARGRGDVARAGEEEREDATELVPARAAEHEARLEPDEEKREQETSPQATERAETATDWLRRLLPERYGELDDAQLFALEELDLHGAALTDADLWRLAAFPDLVRLGLRGTAITDGGLAALTRLPLTSLDLRGTGVSGNGFVFLPSAHLEALHLTDTKVTEADLARLPSLPALTTLKLNFLQLSDFTVETISAQPNLRHVELDGTELSDDGLRRLLALLPHLTRVEARNTRVSPELAAELARTRPGLELVLESVDYSRFR